MFIRVSKIVRLINDYSRKIEGAETSPAKVGHRGRSAMKTHAGTLRSTSLAEESSGSLYVPSQEQALSALTRIVIAPNMMTTIPMCIL